MKQRDTLLNFAVGSAILAILNAGLLRFNDSNIWIPIATVFAVFSLLAIVLRSAFGTINERLRKIEEQRKA